MSNNLSDLFTMAKIIGVSTVFTPEMKLFLIYSIIYISILSLLYMFSISPFLIFISQKLLKIQPYTYKKAARISIVLLIPSVILYGFTIIKIILMHDKWLYFYLPYTLITLCYAVFIFKILFKTSILKSIGLSFSYKILNHIAIILCIMVFSQVIRDTALNPESKEWLAPQNPGLVDADNMYYTALGFAVGPTEDPHQWGMKCNRACEEYYQKKIALKTGNTQLQAPSCKHIRTIPAEKDIDALCRLEKQDCLKTFLEEENKLDKLINENQYLLDRYISLYRYKGFKHPNVRNIEEPMISGGLISKTHKLWTAQLCLQFIKGDKVKPIEALKRDMIFQRLNLIRSDDYMLTMISTTWMMRDLYLYSQFLDWDVKSKSPIPVMELSLLTPEELDFENELRGQFQENAHLCQTIFKTLPSTTILYKPNDAINQMQFNLKAVLDWSRLPCAELSHKTPATFSSVQFWDVGYNPLRILLFNVKPNFNPYIYRLHNLDGLIRLVKIKQQIRLNKIAKDQIDNFLKQDSPYFKNPYTNQPMMWNAKSETLYFNDPAKEGQKIEIKIPTPVK